MNHRLNSFKGVIWAIIQGTTIGVIKGDSRSLDYSPYETPSHALMSDLREHV